MRIVFIISGKRVQKVGYRLFLLKAMKEHRMVGFATNLYTGNQVNVEAWGSDRKTLSAFHEYIALHKPKGVGEVDFSKPLFDNVRQPAPTKIFNEKMDLIIEQTGAFVQHGRLVQKALGRIDSGIRQFFGAMANRIA